MKDVIVRWARTIGCTAFLGTMVAAGTGCGALSAAANPKVAWAVSDPAPMSVVVRRADVAEKTAKEVDRIMTETPANDDSSWLKQVGPGQDEAAKALGELRGTSFYQQGARVVPAEVWAKSLAQIEKKDAVKSAAPSPAPSPTPSSSPTPAEPATTPAPEPTAPVASTEEPEEPKKGQKGHKGQKGQKGQKAQKAQHAQAQKSASAKGGKGGKGGKSSSPATTPVGTTSLTSASIPVAPAAPATAAAPAAPVAPAAPATAATPAAPPVSASSAKYPSLLAAIDKDLGAAWVQVMEKKKAIGEVKGQIAAEEAAVDSKGVSDADRKAGKKKIAALEKQLSALEKDADKLTSELVPQAKAAAKKAPADVRERFGAVVVNLRQAVDDAGVANGAAAVRYPMAVTSLPDSAKQMVAVYVADVVEERTGKRPSTAGLQPNVTMNGTDIAITLNGLDEKDLGKLSMGELTSEVTARTSAWVKRAVGLLGTIAATKEMLSFEDDVLGALVDGFKASGWTPPAATTIPDAPAAAAAPAAPAAPRS